MACCKRYGSHGSHGLVNPTRTGQHASRLALQQSQCFSVSAPSVPQCHSSHLQLEKAENMQAVSTVFFGKRRPKTGVADCQSISACQRIISISGRGKAAFAEPSRQQRASCRCPLVPLLVRLASNRCDRRLWLYRSSKHLTPWQPSLVQLCLKAKAFRALAPKS